MAKFPGIIYSERLPSGEAPAVAGRPVSVDVRTGAPQLQEEYARRGAGIAALGRDIFEMAMTIRKQEDAAEFSELKRKFDEAGFATYNAVTGNEEADAKLLTKFEQDFSTGELSKRGNVNNMLRQHINEVMPEWGNSFAQKGLAIRRKNVKDKFELEAENLLGQGNLPEYYKQLHTRLALQDISQAEFDFKVANAPNDSILQQMRMLIGNNNPQGAITLAAQLKDASADQMDYRDSLIRMAEQAAQINTDAVENEIIYGMHTNKDKTIVERATIGENYITTLKLANIPPARFDKLVGDIEKWMTGEARPNDSMVYVDLVKDVERLKSGVGEPSEVRRKIRDSYSNLDDQHFESITEMLEADIPSFQADETGKILRYAEKQLVTMDESNWMQFLSIVKGKELQDAISKRQLEFWNLSEYDKELRDWIAKNPDATRDEIYVHSRKLLAHYRKMTIPKIELLMKEKESVVLTMEERTKEADIVMIKENRIKVRSPDGKLFTIPEIQKEEAVNQGYVVLE